MIAGQYVMHALEEEVQRIGPPIDPDIAKAEQLLNDFARFWELEDNPGECHKLLAQPFDRVWQDGGVIGRAASRTRDRSRR
jgi:hypothetical protein